MVVDWPPSPSDQAVPEDELIRAERHQALLAGIAELNPRERELLLMLLEDPPPSYAEISSRIGMPVGGIGPTRARAIDKLRRTPAIQGISAIECDSCQPAAGAKG
jgi:DNA-directed RNA polymerase specialized sigma24 family protein